MTADPTPPPSGSQLWDTRPWIEPPLPLDTGTDTPARTEAPTTLTAPAGNRAERPTSA